MIGEPYIPTTPVEGPAVPFDLDRATSLATFHARRLARAIGGAAADEADFRQALLLEAWRRWPRFDPRISSAATFISRVMSNFAASLCREHLAVKRGASRRVDVHLVAEIHPSSSHDPSSHAERQRSVCRDVQECLNTLDPIDHVLCGLLLHFSQGEAAKLLGIPRNAVRRRLDALRPTFTSAGFREHSA